MDAELGDVDRAERWFARSIDHCRAAGARYFLADALLYLGRARAEAGESRERVVGLLAEALELAGVGGYATVARRAEESLESL